METRLVLFTAISEFDGTVKIHVGKETFLLCSIFTFQNIYVTLAKQPIEIGDLRHRRIDQRSKGAGC